MIMRTKLKLVTAVVGFIVLGGGAISMGVLLAQTPQDKSQPATAPASLPNGRASCCPATAGSSCRHWSGRGAGPMLTCRFFSVPVSSARLSHQTN